MALLKNPVHHPHTKQIDVQFHFVREHISSSEILFDYCSMKEMATDILTKAIPEDQFQTPMSKLGLSQIENTRLSLSGSVKDCNDCNELF